MQEQRRQQYLQTMGIQPWFSRKVLPHALPSVRCEWHWDEPVGEVDQHVAALEVTDSSPGVPQSLLSMARAGAAALDAPVMTENRLPIEANKADSGSASVIPAGAPENGLAQLTTLLKSPAPAQVEEKAVIATPSLEPEPLTPELAIPELSQVPTFRLELIRIGEDQLVVAELPHSGIEGFSRFHQHLLDDLLRSIGWTGDPGPRATFHWPLVSNGSIDQGERVARDALSTYLQREFGWEQQQRVMLLGRQAIKFVADNNPSGDATLDESTEDHLQTGTTLQQAGKTLVLCHSLNETMKLPGLKRETWLHLSAMRTPA